MPWSSWDTKERKPSDDEWMDLPECSGGSSSSKDCTTQWNRVLWNKMMKLERTQTTTTSAVTEDRIGEEDDTHGEQTASGDDQPGQSYDARRRGT